MSRIMVMAGGTGGHVMPALAVAKCLRERGVEVRWMGTARGLESQVAAAAGFEMETIHILGLRGKGPVRQLILPFVLLAACLRAGWIVLRQNPDVLLGMGGFVSGPGGLVAGCLRKPLVLHEQNAVAGLTNRWLARMAHRILTGFPQVEGLVDGIWIGNPVSPEMAAIDPPSVRLLGRRGDFRILVVGGSQGARVFNRELPALLAGKMAFPITVRHQVGPGQDADRVRTDYRNAGIQAEVSGFIADMADAYAWSDVVICRAGAMTVAELCASGSVAFLVPYPHAVSDHQTRNAEYLTGAGAAFLVPESALPTGSWLTDLAGLGADRSHLVAMANKARALAKPDAAERVADLCVELAHA